MRGPHLRAALWSIAPNALRRLWVTLEDNPVWGRLLHGAFWSVAGSISSRILALAAAILVARILGRTRYGEWGIIQSTVGMFGTLAGFGMGTTTAKFVAELRGKDPAKAGRIIALASFVSWATSSALAAGMFVLAAWLCERTLAAPSLTSYVQTSALLLLLSGINGAQIGVLSGFEAFKSIARVNFLAGLLNFPLIVGGAILSGLSGAIWGMIVGQAGGRLLKLRPLRREVARYNIPISYSSCMNEFPVLWRFSIPAMLATLLISGVNWASSAMLVRQVNGLDQMGSFSAANQWFAALLWLPYMLNSVVLPMFAERLGANDNANSVTLLWTSIKVNLVVVLPVVLLGAILSPYIMMSYGKGFRGAWPTLVAVLITAAILSIELPVGQLIAASGKMWFGFCSNIGWAVVFLLANVLMLRWGSFGLASARLLAYLAHAIFILGYTVVFIRSRHTSAEHIPLMQLDEA